MEVFPLGVVQQALTYARQWKNFHKHLKRTPWPLAGYCFAFYRPGFASRFLILSISALAFAS